MLVVVFIWKAAGWTVLNAVNSRHLFYSSCHSFTLQLPTPPLFFAGNKIVFWGSRHAMTPVDPGGKR